MYVHVFVYVSVCFLSAIKAQKGNTQLNHQLCEDVGVYVYGHVHTLHTTAGQDQPGFSLSGETLQLEKTRRKEI